MGKTLIATMISKNFDNIIILSPLRIYASQLFDVFNECFSDHKSNLISMDGERNFDVIKSNLKDKNIFSSSFCSTDIIIQLLPLLKNTILIVDEFHNLSLNNLTKTNNNIYKILNYNFDKKIFLSATPKIYNKISEEEYDELETNNFENILGKIEYRYSFTDAIKNKYINDYRFILPNTNEEKDINDFIYSNMLYYGYRKCIVYCKNIDECKQMKIKIEQINKAKYNFDVYLNEINYHTSIKKRKTIIDKFKQEKYKLSIILSVHTLDECIDIPECDSIYFTSDVKNPINIIQRICRSMRIYENKIKSGIFVWCNDYKDIKNIKKTLIEYDNNLQYKINIKTNLKKNILDNIIKDFCQDDTDTLKNNESKDNKFIKLFIDNFGKSVKNYIEDVEHNIWFGLKELLKIFGYTHLKYGVANFKINQKNYKKFRELIISSPIILPLNFHKNTIFINEYGIYELIVKSSKEICKNFLNNYLKNYNL